MQKSDFLKTLLTFFPLLIFYFIFYFTFSTNELIGDETRHLSYTTNLSNGYFAEANNPSLRVGPLYPLAILTPYILGASNDIIRLLNALFLLIAVIFLYKALLYYLKPGVSVALAYIFGLYPAILKYMTVIYAEALALMLVCGFLYYFIKIIKEDSKCKLNMALASSFLGFLVLTKVIFGYVVLAALFFFLLLFIFKRSKQNRNAIYVLIISFMFAIPYLTYTYSITEKPFLWGTQGGEVLYWRTTPFENEFGNWISIADVLESKTSEKYAGSNLYKNHGAFIESIEPLSFIERDARFKEKAIENIKQYPIKNLQNTGSSLFRLFFNYPYTYTPQKLSSYLYIIPNMFLIVFLVFGFYLGIKNRKIASFEIRFLALIAFIFIGGLTLLDGRVRHLIPIIPVLIFTIALVFNQFVHIKLDGEFLETDKK